MSQMTGMKQLAAKLPAVNTRALLIGLAGFGIVSFIIAMGGMAAAHAECSKMLSAANAYSYSSSSSSGSLRSSTCTKLFQLEWWTIFYNLGVYLAILGLVSVPQNPDARARRIWGHPRAPGTPPSWP